MPMPMRAEPLPARQEQYQTLFDWARGAFPDGIAVCDIGGGGHFLDFPSRIRPWAGRMVGVDPDPGVLQRTWYDEAHQALVEDWAPTTEERFDVIFAVYVLEHVEHPSAFLSAARSLLRPGGALFGITPNLWHYFGAMGALSARLGIEDWLLRRVRDPGLVDEYHFPVRYRLNTLRRIQSDGLAAGFRTASFKCIEEAGMFATYFPSRLRQLPVWYSSAVRRVGRPELYGTIIFRLDA
jgi:SAM-dependent methyltransferase